MFYDIMRTIGLILGYPLQLLFFKRKTYYENGKRNPDLQMLRKMSKYFNVSIDFLINGKEFKN